MISAWVLEQNDNQYFGKPQEFNSGLDKVRVRWTMDSEIRLCGVNTGVN